MTTNCEIQEGQHDLESRRQLEAMKERERFLAALKEGIRDLEAGNVHPAEELFEELRARYGS